MVSYVVQKASLQVSESPHTHSIPVRNQWGSHGTVALRLRFFYLKPNSQMVQRARQSTPVRFVREQSGERDIEQAWNASEPRRRAKDTASRCALVPAEKVINTAFVAKKNDTTPLTFQCFLNFPRMNYTLTVLGVNPNKEICRERVGRGRRPQLNASDPHWFGVWSPEPAVCYRRRTPPGPRCRKKTRCCHFIPVVYWALSPVVSSSVDNVDNVRGAAIGWA